jgi:HEPN domain-containing protein
MISKQDLRKIAAARLEDAKTLLSAGRYDGAAYLCGYALECRLKARICTTLKWKAFPSTGKEFVPFKSFRTHDLDTLLRLSGYESKVKPKYLADWSTVAQWEPEARYKPVGSVAQTEAEAMVQATGSLLRLL